MPEGSPRLVAPFGKRICNNYQKFNNFFTSLELGDKLWEKNITL